MNTVVLGYCDYTWKKAAPFVKSLRANGYKGDIVFLKGTDDPYTIQKYEEFGVGMYKTRTLFDFSDALEFLFLHKDEYDRVFASDVRDVIFQDDPFVMYHDNDIQLFEEDLTIGEQPLNSHWIRAGYGQAVLDQLKDKKIINGGVAFGNINVMMDYLQKIKTHFIASEQATLDYLVYTGQIIAHVHPNDGRGVWNIGTRVDTNPDESVFCTPFSGIFTTKDGIRPVVIHQYDRFKRMKELVELYYGD